MFSWHKQNLNDRPDDTRGPMWRHGRAWFRWSESVLCVEWKLLDIHTWPALELEVCRTFGDDEDVAGHVGLPLLGSLYWGISGVFPRRWWDKIRWPRKTGISVFQEYLWITCWWADPSECWGRDDGELNRFRWQRISFDWHTFLLGKQQHKHEVISEWEPIQIPMPECCYWGEFRVEQRTWWRPRWPHKIVRRYGEFRSTTGVPVPGKGENSWDCGEDAIMGMAGPPTKAETIAAVVKAVLQARERHGHSIAWRPREKKT